MPMIQKTFFLLLLSMFLIDLEATYAWDDCVHENYPGIDAIFDSAIRMQFVNYVEYAKNINTREFQNRCRSKFPNPPYKCTIIDSESALLSPAPLLDTRYKQGKFGACYAAAALFALQDAIKRDRIKRNEPSDKEHEDYSLSNAMCVGNGKLQRYEEGGFGTSFLLNIAKQGELVSCQDEKISHEDVVKEICVSTTNSMESKLPILSQIWQKVNSAQMGCKRIKIPAFSINEIVAEDGKTMGEAIFDALKAHESLITLSLPGHETNLYGISTYRCKNDSGEEIKVKIYHLIDPNGYKAEVLADDIDKGLEELSFYITIKHENEKNKLGDIVKGPNALTIALRTEDSSIVQEYLSKKNIDQKFRDGSTLLTRMVRVGKTEVVKLFLENKANIDQAASDGATPLYVAAYSGHTEIVKLLLEKKANVDQAASNGATPLYKAAENNRLEIVKFLIEYGANIERGGPLEWTPLNIAANDGHLEIVKYLIEKGASIEQANSAGFTPLAQAVFRGHLDVVQYLLEKKSNAKAVGKDGRSVLDLASHPKLSHSNQEKILKLIQDAVGN
ncbi:MAG: ankyrin repeat domain-containing protein [Oligoflexia bacterium]|nr:ankyrin repeat domain-containing protein [Oligoflexia bacterium]